MPNVLSPRDLVFRPDNMDETVPHICRILHTPTTFQNSHEKAAIKMDLENDTATIMGKGVALILTTSGHYCIPIDKTEEVSMESMCGIRLQGLTKRRDIRHYLSYIDSLPIPKENADSIIEEC